jgi:phospholipid-translocating ATPase
LEKGLEFIGITGV